MQTGDCMRDQGVHVCACARNHAFESAFTCVGGLDGCAGVCACMHMCMRARAHTRMRVCVYVRACVGVRVWVRVCVGGGQDGEGGHTHICV